MQKQKTDFAERTKKNTIQLAFWTVTWIISLAVATFGHLYLWDSDSLVSIIAIFINLLIGFGMIIANKNHLKGLDEMQQKIQLDAMAISLGVGIVCGISYSLLDQTNLISYDAEISHLIILMGLTYSAGTIIGRNRYQ
jgi:hypothetical protein